MDKKQIKCPQADTTLTSWSQRWKTEKLQGMKLRSYIT